MIQILRDCGYQVLHWQDLAGLLHVPTELLNIQKDRVKQNSFDYWESLEECIDWWIRNCPNSSWEQLFTIIESSDKQVFNELMKTILSGIMIIQ